MGLFNPKVGNVYRFTVRHGPRRPQNMVIWAPTLEAAEQHLRKEWPTADIRHVDKHLSTVRTRK